MNKKKKILVIDDERGFTSMVKLNLEATGLYEVRVQNNPVEALATALTVKPDIILLDIIMPELEGPDIVYQLKNQKILKNIPIIFLTANITKEEVEAQGGMIGGHAFLAKPGLIEDLKACIEREYKTANKIR